MALSRIATAVGGLLLSRGGRRFAGRHAGKLALATLAWELYQQHRANQADVASPRGQRQSQGGTQGGSRTKNGPRPQGRTRWSGRRV